ncbi:MAG: ABC transporter ATP-binding protein [Proteobacteria bacterium]|nr:ABC transporter ATP-binding protein [Pseudomonadota bacterium]
MNALSITALQKTYAGNVRALKGISFDVKEGDFFALLGPNGAGKSTAIGIISCLVNKTSGTVKIFDKDIETESHITKKMVGLVPQEFNFNIFEKVLDIVVNQAGYYGIDRKSATEKAEHFLSKLDLWHKRDVQSQTLSGGMKRKLMIARALVHEPQLLILDEPTAGVDVETRREMWDFMTELNGKGTTIILTTHYLEEAEKLCRNVAIIDKGDIIENTSIKELLSTLESETYILLTSGNMDDIQAVEGYEIVKLGDSALKLELSKDQELNDVMLHLNKQGIKIKSVRSKSNKLEELFLSLVRKK